MMTTFALATKLLADRLSLQRTCLELIGRHKGLVGRESVNIHRRAIEINQRNTSISGQLGHGYRSISIHRVHDDRVDFRCDEV